MPGAGLTDPAEPEPSEQPPDPLRATEDDRRKVIRDSAGVGLAVGVYGVAFGAASVAAGFTPAQTSVSSLLTFTGGSQFAIAGVVAGGGSALAALGSGYLLGSRNTLYALRLSNLLQVRGWRRLLAAQFTIDESTAMALSQQRPTLARVAFWWTAGSIYLLWNLSTLAGAIGASVFGDPRQFGLDAAVPAAFLALLIPQLKVRETDQLNSQAAVNSGHAARGRRLMKLWWPVGQSIPVAVVAAVIAAILIPITPPGVPVLSAGAALVLLLVGRSGRSGERA